MRNLRYILVGLIFGGAVGAKVGAFLSNISELTVTAAYIKSGFIIGVFAGAAIAGVSLLASLFMTSQSDTDHNILTTTLVSSIKSTSS